MGCLHLTFVTENSCKVVVFLKPSFKTCFFRNVGVIKHQQKLVYEHYEYLNKNNDKRK